MSLLLIKAIMFCYKQSRKFLIGDVFISYES